MKELTWKGVGVLLLVILGLWMLNSIPTPSFMFGHTCRTNGDCSNVPSMQGCIKVEGYCNGTLCQVPACLNGDGIQYVRHVGSIA